LGLKAAEQSYGGGRIKREIEIKILRTKELRI
jgi:hypothetical protein